MYCDYEELENYAAKLNQMFKEINEVMKSLENSYKTMLKQVVILLIR